MWNYVIHPLMHMHHTIRMSMQMCDMNIHLDMNIHMPACGEGGHITYMDGHRNKFLRKCRLTRPPFMQYSTYYLYIFLDF